MIDTIAMEKAPLTYWAAVDELAAWHGSDDGTGIGIFMLDVIQISRSFDLSKSAICLGMTPTSELFQ